MEAYQRELEGLLQRFFVEDRHDGEEKEPEESGHRDGIMSKWRQREKLKTSAVALLVCLNIGVDPPDVIKISPCARLECWIDPNKQPTKALDAIGKYLQNQYERWQRRARYRTKMDPTTDDVQGLCAWARKNAKQERVLFHYNGHGVPRPTANGEIWVFNRNLTQYIPLSIYDVHNWLGKPCIYVLDCSAAGLLVNTLKSINEQQQREQQQRERQAGTAGAGGAAATDHMKGVIILAACGPYELLPQSPDLPADVFTSCLTTPLKMALRWFVSRRMPHMAGISKELIDRIPGKQAERRTPLGELNWIFTAITDTIAWNILPRTLFQKLFRQDLLVATLFRNFLLAERILQAYSCTPITYPRLPPTCQHQLWQSWDAAAESCLLQLPQLGNCCEADINDHYRPSTFFSEQLTAFEVWLQFRSHQQRPPEQLPIVLQVLLSQVHRLRALDLLARFLDLGHWAVDLALSVGIFPYVLKLLQTMSVDLKQTLVFIWAKILALDVSCQEDLVRDQGYMYFLRHIDPLQDSSEGSLPPGQVLKAPADSLAQALFVLAAICDGHPRGQELCFQGGLLSCCHAYLHTAVTSEIGTNDSPAGCELLLKWVCLALGKLCEGQSGIIAAAVHLQVPDLLERLLAWGSPEVRAAAVYSMTAMVHCGSSGSSSHVGAPASGDAAAAGGSGAGRSAEGGGGAEAGVASQLNEQDMIRHEQQVLKHLIVCTYDASPLVRSEVAAGMARITSAHVLLFQEALFNCRDQLTAQLRQSGLVTPSAPASDSMQSAPSSPMRSARGRLHPAFAVATNLDPVTRTSVSDGHLLNPPPRVSVHLWMLLQDLHAIREVSPPSVSTIGSVRSAAAAASAATATAAAADAAGCDAGSSGSGPSSPQADSGPRPADAPDDDAAEEPEAAGAAATAAAGAWAAGDALRHARTDMVSLAHLSIAAEGGTDAGASPTAGTDRGPGSSAAAATSGSTLYDHLVNCLCILAMDPSPRVARYGRAVLRLNRHDIKALVQPGFAHSLTAAAPLPSMASVPLWRRAHDDSAVVTPRRTRSFQWPPWASRLAPRSRPGGGGGGGGAAGSTSSTQHGGSAFHPGGVLAGATVAQAPSVAQLGLSAGSNRSEGPMILSSRPAFTLVRTPAQKEGGPTPSEAADGAAPAAAGAGPGIISGTVVCGNSTESTSTTAVTATGTAGAPPGSPNSRSWRGGASGASGGGAGAGTGGGAAKCSTGLDGLHRSPVYCLACQLFQQPLMEPDASASRACRRSEAAAPPSTSSSSAASGSAAHVPEASSGNVRSSWYRPPAVVKEANHLQQVWAACEQLRSGSSFSMAARPRVGGGGGDCTLSMALAPFEPLLVTSDSMGFVRVTDHSTDELRNAFHVATGKGLPSSSRRSGYAGDGGERLALAPTQAASVLQMYCLNQIDNPLLMTCAADGAVRVWRSFAVPEKQTLCTAWQAVCIQPPARGAVAAAQPPTVYHWSPTLHQLLAVGGSTPTLCYAWDLDHELCVQEFSVAGSSAGAGSDCASADGPGQLSIDVLEGGRQDCPTALLAGRSDGEVLLFDLRSPGKEVASFSVHCDKLAGLCFEPGGMSSLLVAAAQAGSVSFLDVRLAGGSGGELRAQDSHRALIQEIHGLQPGAPRLGPLTSLAGHPNAPLIATGSADRSLHLWDLKGGLIAGPCGRPTGPLSPGAAPSSPITCLSFHPYQPLLLAGYGDPLCCSFPLTPGPSRLSSGSASGPAGRAGGASRMQRSSLSEGLPSSRDSSGSSGVAAA